MARISLTRTPLQFTKAEAIAYGAKDTGEMGGGAAAAVLAAAGPQLLAALQQVLAKAPSRRVGGVVVTESFGLVGTGTRYICHVISIIKNIPQGAFCPEPKRLSLGVRGALEACVTRGARSLSISSLGTGEGRVQPGEAAKLMIGAAVEFLRTNSKDAPDVIFSLPTHRDYEAFRAELSSQPGAGGDHFDVR